MSDREVMAAGRFLRMVREGGWEFVERINAKAIVVIIAATDEGRVLFVEQFRPPLGRRVIELPAGLAGDIAGQEDEDLEIAARRELLEETGYEAGAWERIGDGPTSAGLCTEIVTMFIARGLRRVAEGGGDESEDITVHEIPLVEAREWLRERSAAGVPADPKVYAALYFLSR